MSGNEHKPKKAKSSAAPAGHGVGHHRAHTHPSHHDEHAAPHESHPHHRPHPTHHKPHTLHPEPLLPRREGHPSEHEHDHDHERQRAALALLHRRRRWGHLRRGLVRFARLPWVRHTFWASTLALALAVVAVLGLWWRLSQGPIELDMATPWLKKAIEDNFGGQRTVTVGGTQIERDENGRTSLRLRDIVVRDADGAVVASAPKAEVGISGMALLHGEVRAQSLNLVGAEMAVRIEKNGSVTVFAGADKRPIATAAPSPVLTPAPSGTPSAPPKTTDALRSGFKDLAGALAWIDGLGATGLDGHDLRELGLKNGNLIVDDQRNGKHWTFDHINASLRRPEQGGVLFRLQSENPQRPWLLSAALRPLADGVRAVGIEARQVSIRDILLALRVNEGELSVDLPLSASIRADIAADGTPQLVQGQLVAGPGTLVDRQGHATVPMKIERADFRFNWDVHRHNLVVPFQVNVGGNQFTLRAVVQAPTSHSGVWQFAVTRGDPVIDPVILGADAPSEASLALNRVSLRGRVDTVRKRIDLDQGDISRSDTRPLYNVGVAFSGSFDYSTDKPRLAFGVAGTRMTTAVLKRIWPVFIATDVRDWVVGHIGEGTVERVVIAGNAPFADFKVGGPPTPDDGLSVDIETSGTTLRPVPDLPAIHDADLTVRITGSTAAVNLGRGTVEVAPGRRLNIANGLFKIADTHPKPAHAEVHFRIDGGVPAAALLLAEKSLRDEVDLPLDPASSRGTVSARVSLALPVGRKLPPGSVTYEVNAALSSFAADKLLMGAKLESSLLKVDASSLGYQIKGDVKINGMPATLLVTRQKKDPAGQLQLQAKLDEAARRRLGIDLGSAVTGTIPVELSGRFSGDDKDPPLDLVADLTPVAIDNLLPGWEKPAGKPVHVTATLVRGPKSLRFDNLVITGSGSNVKGSIEVDNSGEVVSAHFPSFALSDGDKASLKVDRSNDGVLHVNMRGEVYDGRNFVKTALAGDTPGKSKGKQPDLDLDIKIGTVAGHNGETLRGLSLVLSRRGGRIRAFGLHARIGRDTPLVGDLRLRARDNHQVVFIETADAGALFRFTDMYPRMHGGKMWVAMDPPSKNQSRQIGHLFISNFSVRGEPTLDRIVSGAPGKQAGTVDFTELHCDFTRTPGRMSISDGVVRGPLVGATIEGNINYVKNDVHLRGTFVPFYGLNNMFGQIPIVGLFLGGGSNEGLVGITYEAVGPPSAPHISVNPVSAIAPGLLRKFIPSPGAFDPNFAPPAR